MLKGIDVSNWQKGFKPSEIQPDFCICKATEGLGFVDKQCDIFIQNCVANNILFGFYHFARENYAAQEAKYFYTNTKGYLKKGIPVLDYEVWGKNTNDVKWCEEFIQEFYNLTGIWCVLYISASNCSKFKNSWIPSKCGLWVAGYPRDYNTWANEQMPYNITPWKTWAIWQFTSSLKYNGINLDANYANMTKEAWMKYAGSNASTPATPSTPDYDKLADQVIAGQWGNGNERKSRLNVAYGLGTYDKVQTIVNEKLKATPDYERLAIEVIAGKWGNGWNREQALNNAYGSGTYDKVQKIVNERMK